MEPQIELMGIEPELKQRIEDIVALQLGSVLINLTSLRVRVSKLNGEALGQPSFRCELIGRLDKGSGLQVVMLGSGIHICVADATARLARLIKKQVRGQHINSLAGDARRTAVVEPARSTSTRRGA